LITCDLRLTGLELLQTKEVFHGSSEDQQMDNVDFRKRHTIRGSAYTLEQFAEKYDLDTEKAEDLFYRFGPSSIELDLLMKAKAGNRRELPFVGE
jgi:chemotaxis protein histidine kinase CheA